MMDEISEEDLFKPEFLEDLLDTGENMLSAKDIIWQMEEKYKFWDDNRDEIKDGEGFNLMYEMQTLMEFLYAKMEDIVYFFNKIEDVDWKDYVKTEMNDEEEIEVVNALAENIKKSYEIMYQIIRIRYEWLKDALSFMTSEENYKKLFHKK